MARVFLGLGSNLGDRRKQMRNAVRELVKRGVNVEQVSSLYESEPMYELDQPRFLNAAIKVRTKLAPKELLGLAKAIERQLGRTPRARNGPREIDIDILCYEGVQVDTPELTLPHPRMHERPFVLGPLSEMIPEQPLRKAEDSAEGETTALNFAARRQADRHHGDIRKVEGPEWAPLRTRGDSSLRSG